MNTRAIVNCLKPMLFLAAGGYCQLAISDTRTYAAATDFPIIDAGIVPYYSEAPGRASLAINAAIQSFRDLFARAEVVYDGAEGIHDITIVALAELDGEADYNLLVNGVLVGTATNPEVTFDYTVVRHTFTDIVIPAGAVIAVESLANTNGKIPEGDGTAFARGRWTALELVETAEAEEPAVETPSDIDLNLSVVSSATSIFQNEPFSLELTLSNSAESMTATQPEVEISLALQAISIVSADQCVEHTLGLTCTFPEIPAGTSSTMPLSLSSTDELLTLVVQAIARADQDDRDGTNNSLTLTIDVNSSEVEPAPVDMIDPVVISEVETPPSTGSSSGGLSLFWLLIGLPSLVCRAKRSTR